MEQSLFKLASDGKEMEQNINTLLDWKIKKFTSSLKREFAEEIFENPSTFRSRVIGKLRAGLPKKRPGRHGNPEVRKAAEIYIKDYELKGRPANWCAICRIVYSDYFGLPPELQKLKRYQLRANVHSLRYEMRSRERRRPIRPRL